MSWEEVRVAHLGKLERALATVDKAAQLSTEAPADVPAEIRHKLGDVRRRVDAQLTRLKENRFEVAILGLEKSGKSTLLNAWLGEELAPNAPERCTYTTMEVWAASSEAEQSFRVDYFTIDEFDAQIRAKEQARDQHPAGGKDREDLEEELKEIEQHRPSINDFLRSRSYERHFGSIEEVREELRATVSTDRARARAAKRIVLRTCALRSERDVVFFDVPGFDSPVTLHQEQAAEKLKAVDVILYAKEAAKPSTTGHERRILAIADREDPHVKVAGKTFVALTRIDSANTVDQLEDWIDKARAEWKGVPSTRIVPVCPVAKLAQLGTCTQMTKSSGEAARARLLQFKQSDGIDQLKEAVNRYIDHDRAEVLNHRCGGLVAEVVSVASSVLAALGQKYPEDIGELERSADDAAIRRFHEWWEPAWRRIEEDFARFYDLKIRMKSDVDAPEMPHPSIEKLRDAFGQRVDAEFGNGELLSRPRMKAIYQRAVTGPGGVHQPHHAHIVIRRELHPEVLAGIRAVSEALSTALAGMSAEMFSEIARLLWVGERVRREMGSDGPTMLALYEHGLSTLFLRFARVAVDLLVSSPRVDRARLVERLGPDVLALGHFDPRAAALLEAPKSGEAPKLGHAVTTAVHVAEALKILPLGTSKVVDQVKDALPKIARKSPFSSNSGDEFESIAREIEEDVASLRDLLKSAVFDASGFVAYCHQELEEIRARFLRLRRDGIWTAMIETEVKRHNRAVPFHLDTGEGDFERRKRVAAMVGPLRDSVEALRGP